ncbi:aspartate aminotransferase family protein [Nakamurella leprariae]|uniref:Aspartate aminotransferase family protein n=1 Tax=Nakamurella leprariae TaxID=2803911 RepID=A0A938YA45_9ACTN|nr:aminotransferase class III-fold pyridoxal phosphate-dependent enzyme [Nakamurella leprariae]MBM9466787.1 aspartate aminotransferase family protein [Nakamurella leprariae]
MTVVGAEPLWPPTPAREVLAGPGSAPELRRRTVQQYRDHVNRGLATLASLTGAPLEHRSAGPFVWDVDGTEYLDCGGYGVFLLGHRHPRVVNAVAEQLYRHPLSVRGVLDPVLARAAATLAAVAPGELPFVTLTNSGAEATELGLKLARLHGHRRIIATIGGFHGKSLGALSVTGRDRFRRPVEPLLPDVSFVPYGDVAAVTAALAEPGPPAAVVVEPVQGEGGVVIPPPGWLARVRSACDEAGALLIVDEVQTGLGRLGAWWGCAAAGVVPDVLLTGKVLSGGVVPVGAVLTGERIFAPLHRDPLLHSSTYAGNPLAAAAATATVEVLHRDGLIDVAADLGARLLTRISALVAGRAPAAVPEVRGRGLLIGLVCRDPSVAADLLRRLLSRQVLVSYSLNSGTVVRLTPPAVLEPEHVDRLLGALADALTGLDDTL